MFFKLCYGLRDSDKCILTDDGDLEFSHKCFSSKRSREGVSYKKKGKKSLEMNSENKNYYLRNHNLYI
jgi:hypothetical protein